MRIRKMRFFNSYGFKGIEIKREIWAKCSYCGARMKYDGDCPLDHVMKSCIKSFSKSQSQTLAKT